jgi:cation diffusion facilitator CzcD-associated flavoprotein CzcO
MQINMGNQETPLGEQHINSVNGRVANLKVDFDAIVIGAGFGGLRMMYELQKQGISGKLFESGSGVGGVCFPYPIFKICLQPICCFALPFYYTG